MAQEQERFDGSTDRPVSTGQNISVVDVVEAARMLGVSPSSIRRRIRRGELPAHKVNGRWRVVLDGELEPNNLVGDGPTTESDLAQIEAARQQLEAIRDEWLQPFVLQISHQSERIGRLSERLNEVERERDALREERNLLRARLHSPETTPGKQPDPEFAGISAFFQRVKVNDQIAVVGIIVVLMLWIASAFAIWWAFS